MGRVSDQDIWNFFLNLFGGNEYAAAGACGNMQAESGFYSNNCENSWNKDHLSDEAATEKINSGEWDLNYFLYDSASPPKYVGWWVNNYGWGYGLSQWTTTSRRTELWNRTRGQGLGIDDIQAQLNYIRDEFTGNASSGDWSGVRTAMINANSVDEAVSIYCRQYEGGTPVQARYTYAHDFYDRFAGHASGFPITITANGNCRPYASLHLNEGIDKQIFYAEAGTDVFIHANVGDGDYFQLWVADYPPTLNIDMVTGANTFFTMPASKVNITCQCTGETPEPPTPYPPVPPIPILNPIKRKRMPIWMYPCLRG